MPAPRWDVVVVIAVGGAIGSLARWGLSSVLPGEDAGFPWGTFAENVSGSLLLGLLIALLVDLWPTTRYVRPFVGVGLLGGYTTFSTYMLDAHTLLRAGELPTALGYLGGTLVAGLLATWVGTVLGRVFVVGGTRSVDQPGEDHA